VNPRERRGRVSRRGRERHVSVRLLTAGAVGVAAALMAAFAAQAVVARTSCNQHPLLVNVAVSPDIAPAIQHVGRVFNQQNHQAAGQCVEVQITQAQPAAVASQVDGQASRAGLPAIDAWIPDSSLWIDVARAFPLGAQAQGVPGGAARGAEQGGEAAGPLGAAVGGVVGGVAGGVAGLLGVDQRPRFREYVVREHRSTYRTHEPVTVGVVLPSAGVTLYSIPREFGVPPDYRYAVVNETVVLVEPTTREIVDVID